MPTAELVRAWDREKWEAQRWPQDVTKSDEEVCDAGREPCENETLNKEIERARRTILVLTDDWDGDGGKAYLEETFERAVTFLKAHSDYLLASERVEMPTPSIGPGPDGSIDLHWKRPYWELLVNIPAGP